MPVDNKKSVDKLVKCLEALRNDFNQYVKEDMEWKATADPVIKTLNNLTGTGKFVVVVAGGIAVIIGLVITIKKFLS